MSDADRTRPHLVAVGDPGEDPPTEAPEAGSEVAGGGRGPLFWLLAALAVAGFIGLVVQTQRAGELQGTIDVLEGELFTTRTALDAYEVRFDEVRHSVGSLQAQLEQLNALVSADPLEGTGAEAADGAPAASESASPAVPAD